MTQQELKELFTYNPETGLLKWQKTGKGRKIKPSNISDGNVDLEGYISFQIKGARYKAHRLIWLYMTGSFPKNQIDHINRNPTDNRWANLREVTPSQNCCNRKAKGYYIQKSGKYLATIYVNGEHLRLGNYKTKEEARRVYLEAKEKYHGITVSLV